MYQERFYRYKLGKKLNTLELVVDETDLFISSDCFLDKKYFKSLVVEYRKEILDYISFNPDFKTTLCRFVPQEFPDGKIVKSMLEVSDLLDIGPMAAVAGAISQALGQRYLKDNIKAKDIIIENGGDIFVYSSSSINIGLYAGKDSVINNFSLFRDKKSYSYAICSSSASLGHSLSMGNADLVTVIAKDCLLADALATKLANMLFSKEDIQKTLDLAKTYPGVEGVFLVIDGIAGLWGDLEVKV